MTKRECQNSYQSCDVAAVTFLRTVVPKSATSTTLPYFLCSLDTSTLGSTFACEQAAIQAWIDFCRLAVRSVVYRVGDYQRGAGRSDSWKTTVFDRVGREANVMDKSEHDFSSVRQRCSRRNRNHVQFVAWEYEKSKNLAFEWMCYFCVDRRHGSALLYRVASQAACRCRG